MNTESKYTMEEYEEILEKIANNSATPEQIELIESLIINAVSKVEQILTSDAK